MNSFGYFPFCSRGLTPSSDLIWTLCSESQLGEEAAGGEHAGRSEGRSRSLGSMCSEMKVQESWSPLRRGRSSDRRACSP